MKYTIHQLDGRFSYNKYFKYYIGFGHRMSNAQGPLAFTRVQKWFVDTHGWSAEIRQWDEIRTWYLHSMPMMSVNGSGGGWVRKLPKDLPEECNPNWSWTNGMDDLRIYIAGDKELAFFQLAHPVDQ